MQEWPSGRWGFALVNISVTQDKLVGFGGALASPGLACQPVAVSTAHFVLLGIQAGKSITPSNCKTNFLLFPKKNKSFEIPYVFKYRTLNL